MIVFVTLRDVFQAVIVPRAVTAALRLSRYLVRILWYLWPRIGTRFFQNDAERREDFFGTYAPFYLVMLLVLWVSALVVGWALVFYGLRHEFRTPHLGLGDMLYYAGASLLTIGYGDIVALGAPARFFSLVCGASGLAVVAVVISFLFSVFAAFQAREQFVVTLSARAGFPPSGVGLLEVHAHAGLRADLASVFRDGQSWAAQVMETHMAYPTLIYFRSSHDCQSWVGTLGTLLDAAALVMTTLDREDLRSPETIGQATLMYELGRHLTNDFSHYFTFMSGVPPQAGPAIHPQEFAHAVERLKHAGYRTRPADEAWSEFSALRRRYGEHLNELARWLEIPPLQWIGDRSILHPKH